MTNELTEAYAKYMDSLCDRVGERLGLRVSWRALSGWSAQIECEGAAVSFEPPNSRYFEEVGTTPSEMHVRNVVDALTKAGAHV